jgi:hypothetical protein
MANAKVAPERKEHPYKRQVFIFLPIYGDFSTRSLSSVPTYRRSSEEMIEKVWKALELGKMVH